MVEDRVEAHEVQREIRDARRLHSWIGAYLRYTRYQESPTAFHLWTAISVISGALQHNVLLDRVLYKLYPNHYVILVAESAKCKKSTAVELGPNTFLDKLDRGNVIQGTITCAGLIDVLKNAYMKDGHTVHPEGAVYVLASELTYAFREGSERDRIIRMLIDMYGGKTKSHDITRGLGKIELKKVCINFAGASTPKSITEVISNRDVGIGLIGRVIWVFQDSPREKIAWLKREEGMDRLEDDLMHDLYVMHELRGNFQVTRGAYEFYEHWYNKELRGSEDARTPFEAEYLGRKGDHVLKLSMILSIDESNDLVIDACHIKKSIILLEDAEKTMWQTFKYVGSDLHSLSTDVLLYMYALSHRVGGGEATKSQLMTHFRSRLKRKEDLKGVLDTLEEQGFVTQVINPAKRRIFWRLTGDGVDSVNAIMQRGHEDGGWR